MQKEKWGTVGSSFYILQDLFLWICLEFGVLLIVKRLQN